MSNMTSTENTATLALTVIIIPSIKQGNFRLLMASLQTEDEELQEELLKGIAAISNQREEDNEQTKLSKQLWDITTENYFDRDKAYLGCLSVNKYGYAYHLFDFLCESYEPTEDDKEEARAQGLEL